MIFEAADDPVPQKTRRRLGLVKGYGDPHFKIGGGLP
jgi:hypothetical protein